MRTTASFLSANIPRNVCGYWYIYTDAGTFSSIRRRTWQVRQLRSMQINPFPPGRVLPDSPVEFDEI